MKAKVLLTRLFGNMFRIGKCINFHCCTHTLCYLQLQRTYFSLQLLLLCCIVHCFCWQLSISCVLTAAVAVVDPKNVRSRVQRRLGAAVYLSAYMKGHTYIYHKHTSTFICLLYIYYICIWKCLYAPKQI